MPKSGHMANQHAKLAAAAIIQLLKGEPPNATPVVMNTCYSFVNATEAMHVASVHQYDASEKLFKPVPGAGGVSPRPAPPRRPTPSAGPRTSGRTASRSEPALPAAGVGHGHRLTREGQHSALATAARLRGRFDFSIDLQNKLRSALVARSAAPLRASFRRRTALRAVLSLVGSDPPLVRAHQTRLYAVDPKK